MKHLKKTLLYLCWKHTHRDTVHNGTRVIPSMASVTSSFIFFVSVLWSLPEVYSRRQLDRSYPYYQEIDLCVDVLVLRQPFSIVYYLSTAHLSANTQFVIHEHICSLDTHANCFYHSLWIVMHLRRKMRTTSGVIVLSQTKKHTRVYAHVQIFFADGLPQLTERKENFVRCFTFVTIICLQFWYTKSIYFELFSRPVHTEFRNHAAPPITVSGILKRNNEKRTSANRWFA